MDPARLLRADTPIEVAVLAVVALVSGVGCLLAAMVPLADDAPQTLLYGLGAFGVGLALALRVAGRHSDPERPALPHDRHLDLGAR